MPNEEQLKLIEKARRDRDRAEQEAGMEAALIKQAQRKLDQALREANATVIAQAQAKIADLSTKREAALKQFHDLTERVQQLRVQSALPQPAMFANLGSSEVPLALLPVRLETRFKDIETEPKLLIRVYPDDIHVDAHEREVTEDERTRATQYWEAAWRAGTDEAGVEIERANWNRLCNDLGVERASWIVRLLEPVNVAKRPVTAVAPDAPLTETPIFKKVALRESTWTRPARTHVLPDRWIAICYAEEERHVEVGATIPDVLQVGPKPDRDGKQPDDAKPEDLLTMLDEEMKWLVDFEAAKAVGMGLEVRLSPIMTEGLSRLIVVGVKDSMKSDAVPETLAKLLDAHHYTHGLALVPPGTPTNNTSTERSGQQKHDRGNDYGFEIERRRDLPNEIVDGRFLAGTLSLQAPVLAPVTAGLAGAENKHYETAGKMNHALWSATLGYFLDKRLAILSQDELRSVKQYFVQYVRSTGPLPTLRVGKQPYGLLPVISLDQYSSGDMRLASTLKMVRGVFRDAMAQGHVPTLRDNDSIDWNLMRVLQMSPVSLSYNSRNVVGPVLTANYWTFRGADLSEQWWLAQTQITGFQPSLPVFNPQGTAVFGAPVDEVKPPLVTPNGGGSLQPNYIATLANASCQQLRDNIGLPSNPPPLLYSLLRHALLREYADTAFRILLSQSLVTEAQRVEPELIDVIPGIETPTVWRQLETKVPAITGDKTLVQFLDDPQNATHPQVQSLAELRRVVTDLSTVPVSELERLIPETLDLASHRLDAWITSLATQRMWRKPFGIMLGGYGWVEDLKPVMAKRGSDGYMQTPSLTHATTAAILASGYSSHKTEASDANLFAMNLSSERVRLARSLIEGVRQGQPLAALVGYRIERALYDDPQLARFVATFRGLAPLTGGPGPPPGPIDAVAANNVVHGLRIVSFWKSNQDPFPQLRAANSTLFPAIDAIFRKAEDAIDAVSDLLVADSVYKTAAGNFQRSGLTVEAIARGQAVPEPEIIKTPRTGTVLTHRVVAIFDSSTPASSKWSNDTPRAVVEPSLNAWVGSLLGDPEKVHLQAEHFDPSTQEAFAVPGAVRDIKLSELGLSALDAVALAGTKAGERNNLERWIEQYVRGTRPDGVPLNAPVRLKREKTSAEFLSLDEFLVGARSAARLLGGVRALEPNNLTLPKDAVPNKTDHSDKLRERAGKLIDAFSAAKKQLDDLLKDSTNVTAKQWNEALLSLAKFDFPGAIPNAPASEADPATELKKLAEANIDVAAERLNKVVASEKSFDRAAASIEARIKHDVERIQTILGAAFAIAPEFQAANAGELDLSFKSQATLLAGNPRETNTWLLRLSRVRDRMNRLADLRQCGELLANNRLPLTVAQLPFQENDRWIALPFEKNEIPRGRLSLVAVGNLPVDFGKPLTGVVIDEWTEIVPSDHETTGVTFHYDQPGARPPHCVLLVMRPKNETQWTLAMLEQVLLETLELAKLRLVDRSGLLNLQAYLPALYFAINADGDTVSTDLRTGLILEPN